MNFCRNKKILFFSVVRFSRIFKHLFSEMLKSVFYRFNGIQDNLSESVFYRFNGIENNLSESVFYTESVFYRDVIQYQFFYRCYTILNTECKDFRAVSFWRNF